MCLCVETIRITAGRLPTAEVLRLHSGRLNRTRRELFGVTDTVDLAAVLAADRGMVEDLRQGVVKCRVVYDSGGIVGIEYLPYQVPVVGSLLAVEDDQLEYGYKFCDRIRLNGLHDRALAAGCSDALVVRRGLVTDSTFCNVAFRSVARQVWHTPTVPLLRGTMREYLLQKGSVVPFDITLSDLKDGRYGEVALFNAMNDLGTLVVPFDKILYL